jgi:hypothetical protein
MTHVVDEVNGGFYGAVTNDLQVHNEVPRSAILCARILWTYSAACRAPRSISPLPAGPTTTSPASSGIGVRRPLRR